MKIGHSLVVLAIFLLSHVVIMQSLEKCVITDTEIDVTLQNTRCKRHANSVDPCTYHVAKTEGKVVKIWGQVRCLRVKNAPFYCTKTPSIKRTLLQHSNKLIPGHQDQIEVSGHKIYKLTPSHWCTEELFIFANTSVFDNNSKNATDWHKALKGNYLSLLRNYAIKLEEKQNKRISEHIIQTVLKAVVIPLSFL
eukprot:879817_1